MVQVLLLLFLYGLDAWIYVLSIVFSWLTCCKFVIRKYYFYHHACMRKFVRNHCVFHSCFLIYSYISSMHYQVDGSARAYPEQDCYQLPAVSPQPDILGTQYSSIRMMTWILEFTTYVVVSEIPRHTLYANDKLFKLLFKYGSEKSGIIEIMWLFTM